MKKYLVFLILFFASPVFGATYYVDTTCTDTNAAAATVDGSTYDPATFACTGGSDSYYVTIADINAAAATLAPGDTISFRKGQTWREQLTVPETGTDGNVYTFTSHGSGNKPIISGADDFTTASYTWTASGSGTNEYYLQRYGDLITQEPKQLFMDDTRLTIGTMGSLSDHEWDWGDNDSLKYDTIYVRDNTGDPDESGITLEGTMRDYAICASGKSYLVFNGLVIEKAEEVNLAGLSSSNNVTVIDCEAHRGYTHGFKIDSSTDWTFTNCTASWNWHTGFMINEGCHYTTITRCTAYSNSVSSPSGGTHDYGAGFRSNCATTPSNNVIFEKSISYGNGVNSNATSSGPGFWFDHGGTGNIMRYNKAYDNESGGNSAGIGIYIEAMGITSSVVVHGNLSYGNEVGFLLARETHDAQIYNNTIYNNSVSNFVVRGAWGGGDSLKMEDNIIKNNISLPGPDGAAAFSALYGGDNDGVDGDRNIYLNNCWGAESTNFIVWGIGVTKSTYDAWETAYGDTTNSVEADPVFTNAAGDDFTLQSTSPAIDAGANLGATYGDALIDISVWPAGVTTEDQDDFGSGWEIGAYIFDPNKISPLTVPKSFRLISE